MGIIYRKPLNLNNIFQKKTLGVFFKLLYKFCDFLYQVICYAFVTNMYYYKLALCTTVSEVQIQTLSYIMATCKECWLTKELENFQNK